MKLMDAVKQLNNDELIYIGSKSAFVFIGTPEEFINTHEELSMKWYERLLRYQKNAENAIANHEKSKPKDGESVTKKIQNIRTRKIEDVVISYDTLIKQWDKKRLSLIKTYSTSSKMVEKFVPFDKRTVKEKYPRISNPLSTVFIVTGNEAGNCWTKQEYDKRKLTDNIDEEDNDDT